VASTLYTLMQTLRNTSFMGGLEPRCTVREFPLWQSRAYRRGRVDRQRAPSFPRWLFASKQSSRRTCESPKFGPSDAVFVRSRRRRMKPLRHQGSEPREPKTALSQNDRLFTGHQTRAPQATLPEAQTGKSARTGVPVPASGSFPTCLYVARHRCSSRKT
jgi:hypothetical protein